MTEANSSLVHKTSTEGEVLRTAGQAWAGLRAGAEPKACSRCLKPDPSYLSHNLVKDNYDRCNFINRIFAQQNMTLSTRKLKDM